MISGRVSQLFVDSPRSSDYSTESTRLTHIAVAKPERVASDFCATQQNSGHDKLRQSNVNNDLEKHAVSCATTNQSGGISSSNIMTPSDDLIAYNGNFYDFSSNEFDFPFQATPLFRSSASGFPIPQFTESEREFLLKTLGVEAASPIPSTTTS